MIALGRYFCLLPLLVACASGAPAPCHLSLVLDASGSSRRGASANHQLVLVAWARWIDRGALARPGSTFQIIVSGYGYSTAVVHEPLVVPAIWAGGRSVAAAKATWLRACVDSLDAFELSGGSAVAEAVVLAAERLQCLAGGEKTLILYSDLRQSVAQTGRHRGIDFESSVPGGTEWTDYLKSNGLLQPDLLRGVEVITLGQHQSSTGEEGMRPGTNRQLRALWSDTFAALGATDVKFQTAL